MTDVGDAPSVRILVVSSILVLMIACDPGAVDTSSPHDPQTQLLLEQVTLSVAFDETPLAEVAKVLAAAANVDVRIHPSVAAGHRPSSLLVTLHADNVEACRVLDLVTLMKQLVWRIEGGVVVLLDRSGEEEVLDLYDTKSITFPITSFPGSDGPTGFGFFESPPMPVAAIDGDELAAFLKSLCRRGSDAAYREGGVLLVKARPDDHKRVAKILRWLRSPRARRVFASPLGHTLTALLASAI